MFHPHRIEKNLLRARSILSNEIYKPFSSNAKHHWVAQENVIRGECTWRIPTWKLDFPPQLKAHLRYPSIEFTQKSFINHGPN